MRIVALLLILLMSANIGIAQKKATPKKPIAKHTKATEPQSSALYNPMTKIGRGDIENFVYQVKQIDEFIERFNNNDSTMLRQYMDVNSPEVEAKRLSMFKGLFDRGRTWNVDDMKGMYQTVNDTLAPVMLNFFDENWYADATCSFYYKGESKKGRLILQIQKVPNRASKWVIVSALTPFLPSHSGEFPKLSIPADSNRTMNPVSHGTDFLGLQKALIDKRNFSNYLHENMYDLAYAPFVSAVLDESLEIDHVDFVQYHFLQIPNWMFKVEKVYRENSNNSGWLISTLIPTSNEQKVQYKKDILGID